MKNSIIIIKKQIKDTMKNKTILIQFVLFPILTIIMEKAITLEGMPELFFTRLFAVMYVGMAPFTSMAAIISEEKEKNTLRVLMMANVKPWQYLLGVGVYVWFICMLGASAMATGLNSENIVFFMCVMGIGFFISIIAGACIGMFAKNQMAATSIVMPCMMILAFLPMLATFNEKIEKFGKYVYTEQLMKSLDIMSFNALDKSFFVIVLANSIFLIILFSLIYKKRGLE